MNTLVGAGVDAVESVAIKATDVHKLYGKQSALNGLNLAIPLRSITGVVGPNGSGKTTFLSCLVGLEKPTRGSLTINGNQAGSDAAKILISFTPDDLPMPELLTGREYLELVCELEYRPKTLECASAIAELLGIAPALTKTIGGYSHGMRRRLQFAGAFSSDAPILIMDEPFSGLDVEGSYLLRRALEKWRDDGRTALITLHDLATAQRKCDTVAILAGGKAVAVGEPELIVAESGAQTLEEVVLKLSGTYQDVHSKADQLCSIMSSSHDST